MNLDGHNPGSETEPGREFLEKAVEALHNANSHHRGGPQSMEAVDSYQLTVDRKESSMRTYAFAPAKIAVIFTPRRLF